MLDTIISRYGQRLTVDQLAEVLKLSPGTIRNRMVGHRDINQLMTYYRESAEDIAKRL